MFTTGWALLKMLLTLRLVAIQIEEIEAKHSIIATGSKPTTLPFATVDKATHHHIYGSIES